MGTASIGGRLKSLREKRNLSQEELSSRFGFRDRQTLSAIETGERRVTAEELVKATQILNVPLDFFTDPFVLAGEGRFSWRQSGVRPEALEEYETDAGRLIAAFRELAPKVGENAQLFRRSLKLGAQPDLEIVTEAGQRIAIEFKMGAVPAERLAEVMEQELHYLVLMVDAIRGVSGAACRLPELDVVLINRCEAAGRRHFDLAHELFHILTWDVMPPEHVEDIEPRRKSRGEQLADAFASALLMPSTTVDALADWPSLEGDELIAKLNSGADRLQVTSSALRWRLAGMGRLGKIAAGRIPEERLRNNGRTKSAKEPLPSLFSRTFVEVIGRAIDEGRVSVRRVSQLLNLSIDALAELFGAYGVRAPFEL